MEAVEYAHLIGRKLRGDTIVSIIQLMDNNYGVMFRDRKGNTYNRSGFTRSGLDKLA